MSAAGKGVLAAFGVLQVLALGCLLQPWHEAWRDQAIRVLAFEAAGLALFVVPAVLHQRLRHGRRRRDGARAALDALMSFLAGWV